MDVNFYGSKQSFMNVPKSLADLRLILKNTYPVGFLKFCHLEYSCQMSKTVILMKRQSDFKKVKADFKEGEKSRLIIELKTDKSLAIIRGLHLAL